MQHFAFLNLGMPELIMILLIVLLLFGSRKLPDLARSLGSSMRELRKGLSDGDNVKDQKNANEKTREESTS